MANLLIICDTKRQARNLYYRTINHLDSLGRNITFNGVYRHVIDDDSGDEARFATLYEINHNHIDDGYHGMRIEGYAFDRALDEQEIQAKKEKKDA